MFPEWRSFVDTMERFQDPIQRIYFTVPAQCHRKLEEVESINSHPIGSYRYRGVK